MSEPTGERTEQATAQRMKEVREKGKLSRSQDLTAWLGIGAAAATMPWVLEIGREAGAQQLGSVRAVIAAPDPVLAVTTLGEAFTSMLLTLGPMLAAVVVAVMAGAVLQGGVRFRKFALKAEHLDPVKGLKRTFGLQALWQGLKALLKTVVVGVMLWFVINSLMPLLLSTGLLPLSSLLSAAGSGTVSLLQASILAGVGLAVVDLLVVARRNRKHTRMTKQEVKDEHKKTDGDPLVRQQRRSRQLEMSRNRMIAAVGDADVMIVNPTHVAVALSYQPGFAAPKVVALGTDNIALRLREEAATHRVPMVRDISLARALHAECSLGSEVPVELFTQVAQVLAFVMQLKERGGASGVHTVPAARRQPPAGTKENHP
ncbi:EscU/YscU/HrcU family type III secretion system export apparatus switch protein [Nesterenkonia sandarakina]|uniref:Flagellar biosynthetic protein FlhB n=1 Tax=Nesterenkonia sandarakina TaxID=272918 RepID=A0A7Z0J339_9MICC|nr:EscU/YscU/HrcU family type III secretion system export apparatus switch protein [Nesterenkonia sandarakina]NYJ16910.1 flagellar biosynthetic protein FlhB [Nesterenkonia sandarakina]